jgi:ABC-type transport system substrate-binding protein
MSKTKPIILIFFNTIQTGLWLPRQKNPDTFILANYGNLRTLDPSVAYDVTSSQRLWNIYEPLVFFEGSSPRGKVRNLDRRDYVERLILCKRSGRDRLSRPQLLLIQKQASLRTAARKRRRDQ